MPDYDINGPLPRNRRARQSIIDIRAAMIGSNFEGGRRRRAAGVGQEGVLDEMVALAAAQALRLAAEVEPNGSFALLATEIANELQFVVFGDRPAPERAVPTFPWDDFNAWMREQGS